MNISYRIVLGNGHGFKFPNGTYDGLFGMLQRKEVDTLFFPYPLNELVLADFHAVPVFRFDPVCIMSGVQRLYVDDDFAIATTFDPPAWLAIVVSWLVATTVTTVLYRCETRISGRGSQKTFISQLFSYLQVLLMEGTSMDLRRGSIRLAFLGWALGSVLLGNLINGSVKGSLVVQTPAARIDSVADVMRQRPPPTPYTLKTEFLEKALEESPRAEFRAMHALMIRQGSFLLDYMDMVSPRTFDALMAGTGVQLSTEVAMVEHYRAACSSPGRRFHIAREPILEMMLTWYSSRELPPCFLRQMELRTMWLAESGLPVYRRERFLSQIRSCLLRERTARSEVQEHSALTLRDVKAAFYMSLAVTATALVAFTGEMLKIKRLWLRQPLGPQNHGVASRKQPRWASAYINNVTGAMPTVHTSGLCYVFDASHRWASAYINKVTGAMPTVHTSGLCYVFDASNRHRWASAYINKVTGAMPTVHTSGLCNV
ncbi:uncharacterized protein LOC144124048 [Amblyomma americanum]